MLVVAMAPGFTQLLISLPRMRSTAVMLLNTSPVASTPTFCSIASGPCSSITRARVMTLEMDWMLTIDWTSPAVYTLPSVVTSPAPKRSVGTWASAGM